jgi:type IV pilus assembly protein PilE
MVTNRRNGFTLIEVVVAMLVLAILAAIAYPSYGQYVVRGSRAAAQNELQELASVEEKIYLNSNAYSGSLTTAYDGTATGGLGKTTGQTADGKYTLTLAAAGQSYTLSATPVSGTPQANDGSFSIASDGTKACGTPTPSWCTNGSW